MWTRDECEPVLKEFWNEYNVDFLSYSPERSIQVKRTYLAKNPQGDLR